MTAEPAPPARTSFSTSRRLPGWWRLLPVVLVSAVALYVLLAYWALPLYWARYVRKHPALEAIPNVTRTKIGLPGDPLNIALVGSQEDLHRAMRAAGWYPADRVTLGSSIRIAADTLDHRPYNDAPVSPLVLWGRIQDLAFEFPIGHDPRRRHHVRFWRSRQTDANDRPLWIGAATFDTHVGLSHETEQITHHIGPDVDAERDKIVDDLRAAGFLEEVEWVDDFHVRRQGKNGGGDPYRTDGRLALGLLRPPRLPRHDSPHEITPM
jgi:hypothetical protein